MCNLVVSAGPMVAAYCILRAFSWQLRLSPFPLEHLAAALSAPHPTPLLDEVRHQHPQSVRAATLAKSLLAL